MPAPLYARYVPPKPKATAKPSKEQKIGSPVTTVVRNDSKNDDRNEKHTERNNDKDQNEENNVREHRPKKTKRKRGTEELAVESQDKPKKKDSKRKRTKLELEGPNPQDVDGPEKVEEAVKKDVVEDEEEAELARRHKSVLSKFQRSTQRSRAAALVTASQQTVNPEDGKDEPVELHGLEPIPQPVQPEPAPYEPTFSALPSWLAKPIHIPSSARSKLSELRISERIITRLASQNIHEAFAVQTGVLPLLFPGPSAHNGDLLVSAATGSGKTLAYMLPLIEGIANAKGGSGVSKLRAVVVVPTRELVNQARETAEMCAGGLGLNIGIALGSRPLQMEQSQLVRTVWKWDPAERKRILQRATDKLREEGLVDSEAEAVADALPGHVPAYESAVDILICTPGRLVEHLRNTKGFDMIDCEWLVIDEADRLLDESFQEWVETVISALDAQPNKSDPLERLRTSVSFPPPRKHVRKVILSATMTRDLTKLGSLRLSRPKLVVVQGKGHLNDGETGPQDSTTFELPQGLSEYAIPVGDGSEKPLYLLALIQSRILRGFDLASEARKVKADSESVSSVDSSSDSDTDSDSDSSISTVSSSSDDTSSESGSELSSESETPAVDVAEPPAPDAQASVLLSDSSLAPSILIFVSSTESAARLSHLLSGLSPSLASHITTLTKSTRDPTTRKMLHRLRVSLTKSRTSAKQTPTLIISTDLASRGLDLPLTHVINYDIPTSLSSYIHRAGRTARAEREGEAWTLFQSREGRWFWGDVARTSNVSRDAKVKRVELKLESEVEDVELLRTKYSKVLENMKKMVAGK